MKKKLLFCTAFALCICVLATASGLAVTAAGAGDSVSNTADLSTAAARWTAYEKSDTENSSIAQTSDGVVLSHDGKQFLTDKYYGGLYEIEQSVGNVTDFVLTLTFRFTDWADGTRWFGILYHTQKHDGNLEGYLMKTGVSGAVRTSFVRGDGSFGDDAYPYYGAALDDGGLHTAVISVSGGVATHSLDGTVTDSYETEGLYGEMGCVLEEGGFGLLVNRCSVEITSLTISGTSGNAEAQKTVADETLAVTYTAPTGLAAAPTVVKYITDQADIDALGGEATPATAIVFVDESMNVTSGDEPLISFEELYNDKLRGAVVPAIYVKTQGQAEALSQYLQTSGLLDVAVISDDTELLKSVRSAQRRIRGILDRAAASVNASDMAALSAEAGQAYANTVILNGQSADAECVSYLQARMKSVWLTTEATTEFGVAEAVAAGCDGIVTDDEAAVFAAYAKYDRAGSVTRAPFIVADRGLSYTGYENTVGSCLAACEKGATHVLLDVRLTSDGVPVIMKDETVYRTTDGSGKVSEMTAGQLSQFKVTAGRTGSNSGTGESIPTLEDIFAAVKDKDAVMILQLYEEAAVDRLAALSEEYGMNSKIAVAGSNTGVLSRMRAEMPDIPLLYTVDGIDENSYVSVLYTADYYNAVPYVLYGNADGAALNWLKTRGYIPYLRTYRSYGELVSAVGGGAAALSTDVADSLYDVPAGFVTEEASLQAIPSVGDRIAVEIVSFGGVVKTVNAETFMLETRHDGTYAILRYQFFSLVGSAKYTVYSGAVKLSVQ